MNSYWLANRLVEGAGKAFFDAGKHASETIDWRSARTQWEYSHVARAVLQFAGVALRCELSRQTGLRPAIM